MSRSTTDESPGWMARARAFCLAPRDLAALAAFRVLWGLLMAYGAGRYLINGWVDSFYLRPRFAFSYPGFDWVEAWSGPLMHAHLWVMVGLALLVACGAAYRVAAAGFFVSHAYLELIDVSYYLNHHYLAVLINLLLVFAPAHRAYSVDAWLRPSWRSRTMASGWTYLLRFQIAVVYFYAGLAKLQADWLLHAQPLNLWLSPLTDTAVIGPLLDELWVHYALSWSGFIYDSTIWALLLVPRTRRLAFGAVVVFHSLTAVFFAIGLFPFIMVVSATLFLPSSWPRQLLGWASRQPRASALVSAPPEARISDRWKARERWLAGLGVAYCCVQLVLPLRHFWHAGDVLWNEHGMRWSWKVMVREKAGSITYRVVVPETGRSYEVPAGRYLTRHQEREMAGQPDLIVQLAQQLREDFETRGHPGAKVYVDALVSLNGRPPARLLDPTVDLGQIQGTAELYRAVLPRPAGDPPQLRAAR
jgi:hypothetical protein